MLREVFQNSVELVKDHLGINVNNPALKQAVEKQLARFENRNQAGMGIGNTAVRQRVQSGPGNKRAKMVNDKPGMHDRKRYHNDNTRNVFRENRSMRVINNQGHSGGEIETSNQYQVLQDDLHMSESEDFDEESHRQYVRDTNSQYL